MILHRLFPLFALLLYITGVQSQATCSAKSPCKVGCCSKFGNCGFGPDFCGTGCLSNCDAKAECGKDAPAGKQNCPLNVCCSKWGFCGLTTEFCSKSAGCQNNCDTPAPKCTTSGLGARRVGYYASWATTRKCSAVPPSKIRTTGLTHLIYSFAGIDPYTFKIAPSTSLDVQLFIEIMNLKRNSPKLKIFIAVGGWAFNDPGPTRETFSKMAATAGTRKIFIDSVISFMKSYGFDGIDIDWEYPTAEDRGGKPADTANYVLLVREMKQAFTTAGKGWGLSIAIPASYWYLQHFNLSLMAAYVDWFNLMSYDYVGAWDATNKWTGPYVGAHTNLTMTQQALDLMWRSNVSGDKINMGLGFYGRSFTLKNKACTKPGCQFTKAGAPGLCSEAPGILMNFEIQAIQNQRKITPIFDKTAGVKYMSWDDQWVSFDDAESMAFKRHWAASKCLGGLMIWALDQDTPNNVGLAASIGVTQAGFLALGVEEGRAPRTNCYIAFCGDKCVDGYSVFGYGGGRFSSADALGIPSACHDNKASSICCPSNSMTKNPLEACGWSGNGNLVPVVGPGPVKRQVSGSDPTAPGLCKVGCPAGSTQIAQNTVTVTRRFTRFDEQWTYGYCLEGYASFCCPDFIINPNQNPPPLLYEDAKSLKRRGWVDFLLGPLFADGLMYKKLVIDPEPAIQIHKIGIEIAGKEITGLPALPTDEIPWDEYFPDVKNATSSIDTDFEDDDDSGDFIADIDDLSDGEDGPTNGAGYHERTDTRTGRRYGNHVAVAPRQQYSTKSLTYTCTYASWTQVCENIRSAIQLRGAPQIVQYSSNRAGRPIPERWKAQHGHRNNPAAGQYSNPWLVYTDRPQRVVRTDNNGNVATRITNVKYPTCEVDEYPFHSTAQNGDPNVRVIGRLVPREQNSSQGRDWGNFLRANRVAPWDEITITWTLPARKLGPLPWHESYDLGQNQHCFPARDNAANDRITDPAFAVMTDDPFVQAVRQKLGAGGYNNVYHSNGLAALPNPTNVNMALLVRRRMSRNILPIPQQTKVLSESGSPSSPKAEEKPIMLQPTKRLITVPVMNPTGRPEGMAASA
ncbi:hypothetical protein TWF718_009843 [Orbilia javanica]|uniref:chitinase n=1 Tax=Orbilia javanica TaxID=47235 RepID=A0AAN8NR52_9PEZI